MRRASDLFGLPVIDASSERKIASVYELLLDLAGRRVEALVLPGLLLTSPGLIPADRVKIKTDAILLDQGDIVQGEDAAKIRHGKLTLERVRKLTVYNRSGSRLGNVEDLILDGSRVIYLELSDGLIQDIFQGRRVLHLPDDVEVDGDKVIVADDAEPQLLQPHDPSGAVTRDYEVW